MSTEELPDDLDELKISYTTWRRLLDPIEKDGFREGFAAGRTDCLESGFNIGMRNGFEHGYNNSFKIGKARLEDQGSATFQNKLQEINGACVICSTPKDEMDNMDMKDVIKKQVELHERLEEDTLKNNPEEAIICKIPEE